jgi:hypothetical protein
MTVRGHPTRLPALTPSWPSSCATVCVGVIPRAPRAVGRTYLAALVRGGGPRSPLTWRVECDRADDCALFVWLLPGGDHPANARHLRRQTPRAGYADNLACLGSERSSVGRRICTIKSQLATNHETEKA